MRQLSFHGFIKAYVKRLSLQNTNNIKKLAVEVNTNDRLREPLLLYAASANKLSALVKATYHQELREYYAKFSGTDIVKLLEEGSNVLDEGCKKAYRSYLSRRNMPKTMENKKALMRNRILKLQAEKGVSNYRVYKALGMNRANVNSFLKNGAVGKVSLENARKILEFMENA